MRRTKEDWRLGEEINRTGTGRNRARAPAKSCEQIDFYLILFLAEAVVFLNSKYSYSLRSKDVTLKNF